MPAARDARYVLSRSRAFVSHWFLQALENIVYYVVLAPHDNEQSNMLHKLFVDPAVAKLEVH